MVCKKLIVYMYVVWEFIYHGFTKFNFFSYLSLLMMRDSDVRDVLYSITSFILVLSLFYISTSFSIILVPLYFLLVPFNRDLFVWIGNVFQNHFLALVVHLLEKWCSLQINVSGELPENSESSIIIPNHLSHDWPVICSLAYHKTSLGNLKILIKDVAKFVPGFGWSIWLMFWPFVSRKWALDQKYLENLFSSYANQKEKTLLCMFCEGTRFSEKSYKLSQEFVKKTDGCPSLEYCLVPRARGFISAAKAFLKASKTPLKVYNMTLVYTGFEQRNPSMLDIIFKRPKSQRTVNIFSNAQILDQKKIYTDEELKQWLFRRFVEKDEILKDYYCKTLCKDSKMSPAGNLSFLTILPHALFCVVGSCIATRMYACLFNYIL